jgi:hypothetical protein
MLDGGVVMEKRETAAVLALLASAYPYAKVSKETAAVYHGVWLDLAFEDCRKAAETLIRVSDHFPSAAAVRREVLKNAGRLSASPAEAWGMVTAAVRESGRYKRPEFANKVVEQAVCVLGWREICDSESQGVLRAHFFKVYEKLAEEADRSTMLESIGELGSGSDATRKAVGSGQTAETDSVQEADEIHR